MMEPRRVHDVTAADIEKNCAKVTALRKYTHMSEAVHNEVEAFLLEE